MLPPASVLTNKNCGVNGLVFLLGAAACSFFFGCTPAGPSALLEGKRHLDEGKYASAVEKLEKATRLLPKNAQAWNHLGLAYHGNGQPEQAMKAYQAALTLDHKLSAVRYNLGCLYLSQTNLPAAIDELKSYTLVQPSGLEGWLKLGAAFLRARRLDEAEKSFRAALDLHPRHPEALNGLGLVQYQRRRWQDALNHFNVALVQDPNYAPALLNSAIVNQIFPNNRSLALKRYRQYLALQPRPADWESVDAAARQLEQELNPPPLVLRPVSSNVVAAPKTDLAVTVPLSPRPASNAPTPHSVTATRTNLSSTAALPRATSVPTASAVPPSVKAPSEPKQPIRPAVEKMPEVEVTHVQSELVVKPAQELAHAATTQQPGRAASAPEPGTQGVTSAPKKGFLSRLNPFGGKGKTDTNFTLTTSEVPSPSDFAAAKAPSSTGEAPPPATAPVTHYSYLSPGPPTPGKRAEAEKLFRRGLNAQKSGNRAQAIAEYQSAVKVDPAYFDAYYNLGLAALDAGEIPLSLWAYELALALKPTSTDARYNFALALKSGGYTLDAADQFLKMVQDNPDDARAHLSLANLYSQRLEESGLARKHYLRVLEINPKHPEANKIRYWLAAHP